MTKSKSSEAYEADVAYRFTFLDEPKETAIVIANGKESRLSLKEITKDVFEVTRGKEIVGKIKRFSTNIQSIWKVVGDSKQSYQSYGCALAGLILNLKVQKNATIANDKPSEISSRK